MVSKPGQRRTLRIAYLGNLASSIRAPARGQGNRQAGQRCLTIDHRCQSSHLAMNKPLNHSRCSCWYHVSTSTSCLFYSVRCHGLRVFPWTCLCMHAHGTVPSASSHIYPRRRIPHPPEPTKKRVSYTRPLPQHSAEHEPGRFHFTCTDTSRPVPLIRGHPASESRSDCSNARNHGIPAAEVLPACLPAGSRTSSWMARAATHPALASSPLDSLRVCATGQEGWSRPASPLLAPLRSPSALHHSYTPRARRLLVPYRTVPHSL